MELNRFISVGRPEQVIKAIIIALFAFAVMLSSTIAQAAIPKPRLKPPAPNASQYLSDEDSKRFRNGLRAAKKRQWSSVSQHIKKIDDPTAKDVLRWIRAARDANVSFKDISYVVHDLPDWPRMTSIQAKAEGILFDQPLSAHKTIDWFRGKEPVAGEGLSLIHI